CLYTFPCQWNYRPDHCMYGSNCKGAEEEGVSILHGNRGVYHDDKQPAFKVVYDSIHDYPVGENLFQSLFYPLQTKFLDTVNTLCGRVPQVFLKQIEKTMKIVFEQKVVRHAHFEKKGKKEVSPVLDQFLSHVAKTGETMVSWSQFKSYFLFKLEKVMEDFHASAPEQRGPANPNVESVPFEEMKERILKIVNGYNGIPFTIQRLCELLTDPKRNYTGTEKFLRGVEKNVMVVSCVYPTFEKNGCSGVNRMNGVMLPGSTSIFTERKVNGPGTPRPMNRLKISPSSSLATNGLLDSTENKDSNTPVGHSKTVGDVSGLGSPLNSCIKNKHAGEEEDLEEEQQEVKKLKFSEEADEDDEEEDTEVESDDKTVQSEGMSDVSENAESPSSMMEEKHEGHEEEREHAISTAACEDQ
ncbi:serine/threonine-protein phosphatase 4 regulatory subunit 2-B-like, partial [Clarias magur]